MSFSNCFRFNSLVFVEDRLIHASGMLSVALFWVAAAVCLVAQVALLRSAFRMPQPVSSEHPLGAPGRGSEIAWSLLPAVMLALALLFTWREINRPPVETRPRVTSASLIAS